jgi:small conductance mechanosensitive channel
VVRAWCATSDYWPVLYKINEDMYNELPKNGLSFPFPQLDVHFDKTDLKED